jgi:uncharacterized membrane protein
VGGSRFNADRSRPRPVLKLSRSRAENVVDGLTAIVLLASFGVALWYWPTLPARVPTHFNVAGKVDGWGPRSTVWLLPVAGLVFAAFLTVLSRFPHTFNYPCAITPENAERQYRMARLLLGIVKLSAVVIFCTLELMVCSAASGQNILGVWFLVGTLAGYFAIITAYLISARHAR